MRFIRLKSNTLHLSGLRLPDYVEYDGLLKFFQERPAPEYPIALVLIRKGEGKHFVQAIAVRPEGFMAYDSEVTLDGVSTAVLIPSEDYIDHVIIIAKLADGEEKCVGIQKDFYVCPKIVVSRCEGLLADDDVREIGDPELCYEGLEDGLEDGWWEKFLTV